MTGSWLVFTLCFGLCLFARANVVGNDTQNFNPAPDGLDFLTVHSSETLIPGYLNTGFFLNQGKNVLPDTVDIFGNVTSSKDSVTFADMSLAYGVSERVDVGLSFSYLLDQQTNRNVPGAQFGETGLNEIRIAAKYRIKKRSPWGSALVTSLNLNQVRNNPFAGSGSGPTFNLEGVVDYTVGKVLFAGNLGYRLRSKGQPLPNAVFKPLSNQMIASLAASYYLTAADLKLIAEWFAAKSIEAVAAEDSNKLASELLFGVKYDAFQNASLQAGAGTATSKGLFTPDWRVYVGLNIALDMLDRPKIQADGKGTDAEMKSRVTLRHVRGFMPGDIDALQAVPFDDIAKRHEFQLRRTVPAKDYAGEKPPLEIIRLENFDFDSGSHEIRSEYKAILDQLGTYLESEPKVLKIRIEGHTDSLGSFEKNKALSQARAEALEKWLRKHGLKNVQVEPVGFGSDRPIADNSNFQGRKANRRVEIRILRQISDVPEKVEIHEDPPQ